MTAPDQGRLAAALQSALGRLRLEGAVFLRAEYREPWAYESLTARETLGTAWRRHRASVRGSAPHGRGVLERRPYDERPRYEYVLTEQGTELVDLLMVMVAWGDKWLAGPAGPPVLYRHHACGQISHVDLRCAHCGQPMHAGDVDILPGPGARVTG